MLLGLPIALPTFQAYIDNCLQPSIEDFAVWHPDDILSNPTNDQEHEEQVRKVPERPGDYGPKAKPKGAILESLRLAFLDLSLALIRLPWNWIVY